MTIHRKPSLPVKRFWLVVCLFTIVVVLSVLMYFGGNWSKWNQGEWRGPVALISVPAEMQIGEAVECNATASYDPHNEPLSFQWDLDGDESWDRKTSTGILEVSFWDDLDPLGYWHNDEVVIAVRVTNSSGFSSVAKGRIRIINPKRRQ